MPSRRRALLWAIFVAVGVGFAAGWCARVAWDPSPESRARSRMDDLMERTRRFMR